MKRKNSIVKKLSLWGLELCMMVTLFAGLPGAFALGEPTLINFMLPVADRATHPTTYANLATHGWQVDLTPETGTSQSLLDASDNLKFMSYGLSVGTSTLGDQLVFKVNIPSSGNYQLNMSGAIVTTGGVAGIYIDDIYVGSFDYGGTANNLDGLTMPLSGIYLTEGTHTITHRLIKSARAGTRIFPKKMEFVPQGTLPGSVVVSFADNRITETPPYEMATLQTHGWEFDKDPQTGTTPSVLTPTTCLPKSYGIWARATEADGQIVFRVLIPNTGYYSVDITGGQHSGGTRADVFIDGFHVGKYDFCSAVSKTIGDTVRYGSMYLSSGIHTVTFRRIPDFANTLFYMNKVQFVGQERPAGAQIESTQTRGLNIISTGINGELFYQGSSIQNGATLTPSIGETVVLHADGDEFRYWKNSSTGHILGTQRDYTFTIGSDTEIEAVFRTNPQGENTVEFIDRNGRVLKQGTVPSGQQAVPPADPYSVGYTFEKWNRDTAAEIVSDTVFIAEYNKDAHLYPIKVSGGQIQSGGSGSYTYNTELTIAADNAPLDQAFQYWTWGGRIVSYDPVYTFYVWDETSLQAHFAHEASLKAPQIMLAPVVKTASGKRIMFMSQRIVPQDFQLIETGILLSNNADVSLSNYAHKSIARTDHAQFTTRLDGAQGLWYGRAYLIYKDTATGNMYELYSETVSVVAPLA